MSSYIGIDVGGTKVAAARLDLGVLGEAEVFATELGSTEALLDQIVAAIESQRAPGTLAVGLGVPSVIEFATGRARYSVNIPLADVPLREVLSARVGLPVFVENDANCAALAEAWDGSAVTAGNLVMFTVGTGVGGGLVLGGRLYRGATGAAPELGHIVIGLDLTDGAPVPDTPPPYAGTLEVLASGSALDDLARAAGRGWEDGRDAVEAARAGDEDGMRLLRILGSRLGVGIANTINLFDPDEVVVGGGVSAAGDLLLDPARETAARYILPGVGTATTIRLARRGPEAGVLGAALLALQENTPL